MEEGRSGMIIGIVKETKADEYRVAATPYTVDALVKDGNQVLVQTKAGESSGFPDKEYAQNGATIVPKAAEIWNQAEMIYHIKEPMPDEYSLLREDQILLSYLHLAAARELTQVLLKRRVAAIAYETMELPDGSLPLLDPMSEVAGKVAIQSAAYHLGKIHNGCGKLLGGVTGVPPGKVVILGGGVVGINAAKVALGIGARVVIIDKSITRLRYLSEILHGRFETMISNPNNVADAVKDADVVVGCVLTKGCKSPIVLTREMVKSMKPGSVIVDVAVDQGGCVETTHPTTHSAPVYLVNGVIHYCVTNIPSIFPQTSTIALSNATLPYARKLANLGFKETMRCDETFRKGLNVYRGKITNEFVAKSLGLDYAPFSEINSEEEMS